MKTNILLWVLCFSLACYGQDKYYTKSGNITFESSVPSFEEVKATNTKVTAVLKEDGAIAALALNKAFGFKIALMEEHFNENYVESETYPKATFRGGFVEIPEDLSQEKEVIVNGIMDFHGVQKEMEVPVRLQVQDEVLVGESGFVLLCSDFGIKIPKIVSDKLANEIQVTIKAALTKI